MEGGRDCNGGVAGAAAGQERRRWRGVELSLRLRTGATDDDGGGAASAPPPVEARRNMTIFYNGRVCAVDVTEVQVINSFINHHYCYLA